MRIQVLSAFVLMLFATPSLSHDENHPNLDSWYTGLKSESGGFCCDGPGKDAVHLSEVDWESKDGHYRVFLEGKWWDVPDGAVLKEPNLSGQTLVWPIYYRDIHGVTDRINIRCFIPGAQG